MAYTTYSVDSAKQFAYALDSLCPSWFKDSDIMSDIYSDLLYAESDKEVVLIMQRFTTRIKDNVSELCCFYNDVNSDFDAWIKER